MHDFINTWLAPVNTIVGLIIAIPIFWTWWQVIFGEPRQRRRWLREVCAKPGQRPGVLILDLLPGRRALAQVRNHLAGDPALKDIPEERIVHVSRDDPLTPEDLADYARAVRAAVRRLQDAGVDSVHLFHAGPIVSAMVVGAELANGPRVIIYHNDQGRYIAFGPLEPLRAP